MTYIHTALLCGEFAFDSLVLSAVLNTSEGQKGLRVGKEHELL